MAPFGVATAAAIPKKTLFCINTIDLARKNVVVDALIALIPFSSRLLSLLNGNDEDSKVLQVQGQSKNEDCLRNVRRHHSSSFALAVPVYSLMCSIETCSGGMQAGAAAIDKHLKHRDRLSSPLMSHGVGGLFDLSFAPFQRQLKAYGNSQQLSQFVCAASSTARSRLIFCFKSKLEL
jgi:hypothetical protein